MGHGFGRSDERGVYKTTDGGKTWKKQLYKNNTTGCSDLDIDPTNSNIVYAGMTRIGMVTLAMRRRELKSLCATRPMGRSG